MTAVRLDHIQLAMPLGREADAVGFYEGLLGIPQCRSRLNLLLVADAGSNETT